MRKQYLWLSLLIAACTFAAIVLCTCAVNEDTHAQQVFTGQNTHMLTLDTTNNALMHKYGLPTKADVMQYHVHGQWGFFLGGTLYAYDRLPGDSKAWDEMYEIDSNNPAFDK